MGQPSNIKIVIVMIRKAMGNVNLSRFKLSLNFPEKGIDRDGIMIAK